MAADGWLEDPRASYDEVAVSYADQLHDVLDGKPYLRAALAMFADMVRAAGGGPVADLGCGPGHITAHLHGLGQSSSRAASRSMRRAWLRDPRVLAGRLTPDCRSFLLARLV